MSKCNDGGPAFPKTGNFNEDGPVSADSIDQDGMSLRDYFAAKALQGIAVGSIQNDKMVFGSKALDRLHTPVSANDLSRWSYELADAMLAARDTNAERKDGAK